MKKILFLLVGLVIVFSPVLAMAEDSYGLETTAGAAKLKSDKDLPTLVGNVAGTALSLVGVIFFALMIYAGFLWMTAQGKEEQAKKALDTIIACIIGLIIILAAYAITRFIFNSAGVGGSGTVPQEKQCDATSVASCKSKPESTTACTETAGGVTTNGFCHFVNPQSKSCSCGN
ncbi:MAG: hypothetical protein US42_C0008G0064 [Candidatus Magasanikbacteria bacterium GW2011_GWC2_37_14]|uniref:TrbC/VIRB2 family protein n=1 Tax=Candidatus Magasanikbacteria bacterium GW2011_GWC2_37_14 TaxID=1619046 RepID=A0A0G0G8X6_9BACT|nr:MAG: hypothetical protein US42_C0008G0064 [Candidatus Magasanikbacteria bacterium GW2011_GWC2_37_14]